MKPTAAELTLDLPLNLVDCPARMARRHDRALLKMLTIQFGEADDTITLAEVETLREAREILRAKINRAKHRRCQHNRRPAAGGK